LEEYIFLRDLVIRSYCEKYRSRLEGSWIEKGVPWASKVSTKQKNATLQLLRLHASKVS